MEWPEGYRKVYVGYVSNGTAILASLFLGFEIRPIPDYVNVLVKIVNTKAVRDNWYCR